MYCILGTPLACGFFPFDIFDFLLGQFNLDEYSFNFCFKILFWIPQFYLRMVWGLPCNSMRFIYSNSSSIQGQPVLVIPFFQGGLTMCQPGPANILHYFNRFAWLGSFLIMFLQKMCPFTGKIVAQIDRNTGDLVEMWYWIHFFVFYGRRNFYEWGILSGDLRTRVKSKSMQNFWCSFNV